MTTQEKSELQVAEKRALEKSNGEPTWEGPVFVPQVDILADSDAITARADLPGASKDRLSIDVQDGVLTLSAPVQAVPERWRPIYAEYEVGGYSRRFTLGEQIDQDKISARLDNGVLHLVLPKAERHKPRKIQIS